MNSYDKEVLDGMNPHKKFHKNPIQLMQVY